MRVLLFQSVAQAIAEQAQQAWPAEVCGFLLGWRTAGRIVITDHRPMPNVSPNPKRFQIDPAAQIALFRHLRQTGQEDRLIGPYHSHPSGNPRPSVYDQPFAAQQLWLIAALRRPHNPLRFSCWWSQAQGFNPAPLRIVASPRKTLHRTLVCGIDSPAAVPIV